MGYFVPLKELRDRGFRALCEKKISRMPRQDNAVGLEVLRHEYKSVRPQDRYQSISQCAWDLRESRIVTGRQTGDSRERGRPVWRRRRVQNPNCGRENFDLSIVEDNVGSTSSRRSLCIICRAQKHFCLIDRACEGLKTRQAGDRSMLKRSLDDRRRDRLHLSQAFSNPTSICERKARCYPWPPQADPASKVWGQPTPLTPSLRIDGLPTKSFEHRQRGGYG